MFNIPIIYINMPKRIVSPNVLSVLGSPGTRQSFWGQLGQADQAAFRLCSKQARDLSNDLIHTLFLKLPCGDVQKGQVLDHEPDAAQLARLHAGSFKHAWELQVTYQSTSSRQGATDHTAQYLAHYLAVVGTLPLVRMCKINLGAQERLCMPVAAMLACMLPSIELLFINLVDYDNEPPSALLQAFK